MIKQIGILILSILLGTASAFAIDVPVTYVDVTPTAGQSCNWVNFRVARPTNELFSCESNVIKKRGALLWDGSKWTLSSAVDFDGVVTATSFTADQTASGGALELLEATGGSNKLTIQAPTSITSDGTCTLLNTTSRFIPNSCLETIDSADITDSTIAEADLSATNSPTDNYCLTYDQASVGFTWETCGAGGSNTFLNIDASSGTDPQADTTSDTLIVTGTSPITVTGDSGADSITIAIIDDAIGTAKLNDGSDTPAAGEVVVVATGATAFEYLPIVSVTESTPQSGHMLIYDGTDSYDNKALSGDATIINDGTVTVKGIRDDANHTVDSASNASIDTSTGQLAFYDGAGVRTLNPTIEVCDTFKGLVDTTDDNVYLHAFRYSSTVKAVGCQSSAATTITIEDNGSTAVESNIVCATGGSITWDTSLSGTATFTTGEVIQFDTVSESDPAYTLVCFTYEVDRQ